MTKEELRELISLGEGQTLEFKRSTSDDFGREMVAFANSLGGTLLIGVDDKGVIIGADTSNRANAQIQNAASNLTGVPPIFRFTSFTTASKSTTPAVLSPA